MSGVVVVNTITNVQYDAYGNAVAVRDGYLFNSIQSGLMISGTDGINTHIIRTNSSGQLIISGTGTDNTTNSTSKLPVLVAVSNTSAPSYTSGNMVPLSVDTSGALRITGNITANNSSVSTTGTAPPASATYVGGSVTTAAPSYTTGQLNALSLNTSGGLRVDGSGVTQPISGTITANAGTGNFTVVQATAANLNATVSGTVTSNIGTTGGLALDTTLAKLTIAQSTALGSNTQALMGGSVTTAAPTYTTGNINPLSLTTTGLLRVDGSGVTQPVSQSGTWTNTVTQATAANLNATVIGSGNFTVVQATAANLNATVTGTVTANIGTTNGLALDATLTGGTQKTQLVDGYLTQITARNGSNFGAQNPTFVVSGSDGNNVRTLKTASDGTLRIDPTGTTTQPVSGTVTANIGTTNGLALDATVAKLTIAQSTALGSNTQALVGGSVTTASPTYTTGNINPLSLTTAGALRVDGTATTQPVSGTVTANQGTSNTLANRWPVIITDGTNTMPTGDIIGRAIFYKLTDGTNTATIKASSTASVVGDTSLVTAFSPNSPLPTGSNVIGGVTQSGTWTVQQGTPPWSIVGNVASGATDSGNPVKIGGVFNTSLPTLTTGQRGDLQLDNSARLIVAPLTNTSIVKAQLQDNAGTAITLGQKVMASSVPVVISSDQAHFPIELQDGSGNNITSTLINSKQRLDANLPSEGVAASAVPFSTTAVGGKDGSGNLRQLKVDVVGNLGTTIIDGYNTEATIRPGEFIGPQQSNFPIAGSDGTYARTIKTDAYGNIYTTPAPSVISNPGLIGGLYNNTTVIPIDVDSLGRIITAPAGTSSTVSGFAFGDITLAAVTTSPVERTAYTEQTTNFTGSVVSSSASDAPAGVGAITVKITYYDQTGAGPNTETVTLNGTTAVNLVNTNHCYIEKMEVLTVGTNASNVGTITLKTGVAGAGTTVGTIGAKDNQTFWCHHYVAVSKTCYITDTSIGSTATTVGTGSSYVIKAISINSANAVEKQVSDFLSLYGQSSQVSRNYGTPIQVTGPARIRMYATTQGTSSNTYRSSFDFYDQ